MPAVQFETNIDAIEHLTEINFQVDKNQQKSIEWDKTRSWHNLTILTQNIVSLENNSIYTLSFEESVRQTMHIIFYPCNKMNMFKIDLSKKCIFLRANVDVYAFLSKCGVDPVLVAKSFSHVARLWYRAPCNISRLIHLDKQLCVYIFVHELNLKYMYCINKCLC